MYLGMVMTQHVQRPMHNQPNEFLSKRNAVRDRRPAGDRGTDVHISHERPIVLQAKRDHIGSPIPREGPTIQRAHALAREEVHVHPRRRFVFLLEHRLHGPANECRAQSGCHPGGIDHYVMRGQPVSILQRSHLP